MKSKTRLGPQHSTKVDSEILAHLAAASSLLSSSREKAVRHVKKARKVAMRKTIRLPRSIRSQFCNKCKTPFVVGVNCKVRTRNKLVIFHCANCKHMQKFGSAKKTQ